MTTPTAVPPDHDWREAGAASWACHSCAVAISTLIDGAAADTRDLADHLLAHVDTLARQAS